jgi:hypothetical protein
MSQAPTTAKRASDITTEGSDAEYQSSINFLQESCPAFNRYRRELKQFIVDKLYSANCLIDSSVRQDSGYPAVEVPIERLKLLQEINQSVIDKLMS